MPWESVYTSGLKRSSVIYPLRSNGRNYRERQTSGKIGGKMIPVDLIISSARIISPFMPLFGRHNWSAPEPNSAYISKEKKTNRLFFPLMSPPTNLWTWKGKRSPAVEIGRSMSTISWNGMIRIRCDIIWQLTCPNLRIPIGIGMTFWNEIIMNWLRLGATWRIGSFLLPISIGGRFPIREH